MTDRLPADEGRPDVDTLVKTIQQACDVTVSPRASAALSDLAARAREAEEWEERYEELLAEVGGVWPG